MDGRDETRQMGTVSTRRGGLGEGDVYRFAPSLYRVPSWSEALQDANVANARNGCDALASLDTHVSVLIMIVKGAPGRTRDERLR